MKAFHINPRKVQTSVCAGVTLIELMVVLAIVAILALIGYPSYRDYVDKTKITQAKADILRIDSIIARYNADKNKYPDDLSQVFLDTLKDPWGNGYEYLNIATVTGKGKLRKDRNLVPINTDYDLYSKGPDGLSVGPLTASKSQDDIIRAGNGGYIGLAKDF